MTTVTLDTHKLVRTLKESGIPESQAESIVEVVWISRTDVETAIKEAVSAHDNDLRHALRETELRLDARIAETELRLEAKIAEAKTDLTRWVVGAGILQTSLIVGVLLKIAKLI